MTEDIFFNHFIVGALLILAACVIGLVGFLVWSLWQAGFGIFAAVLVGLCGFCWIVHRIVKTGIGEKIMDWM